MLYVAKTLCLVLAALQGGDALVVGAPRAQPTQTVFRGSTPMMAAMPLTKVVATVGPASEEFETLQKCLAAGMSVMRCNFSHATKDEFFLRTGNLRKAKGGERINLMLDTKGPEIRMGGLKICKETGNRKAKIEMVKGEMIVLTNDPALDVIKLMSWCSLYCSNADFIITQTPQ